MNSNGRKLASFSIWKSPAIEASNSHGYGQAATSAQTFLNFLSRRTSPSQPATPALSTDKDPVVMEVALSLAASPQGRVTTEFPHLAHFLE